MPGAKNRLKTEYSFAVNEGFAQLQRMAGRDYHHLPPNSGNTNDDIYLDAVYGGHADPEEPQEFTVYSVDWDERGRPHRVDEEPSAPFEKRLDEEFPGWIYRKDSDELYVLKDERESHER